MPQSSRFEHLGATLRVEPLTEASGPLRVVWLHGWGQSRENLRPLATALLNVGESWLIDLPGHGEAPPPPGAYGPAEFAQMLNTWLQTLPTCPTLVVGHSLGFRVALHMARQNPNLTALVSIAGAGVPRSLSPREFTRRRFIRLLIALAKALSPVVGNGVLAAMRRRFGSRDYLAVGENMRPTFLAVVNDDATAFAPTLGQPSLLIYGSDDTETPPDVGQKFSRLLPQAELHVLPGFNHYNILVGGRHVTEKLIRNFLQTLNLTR